MADLFKREEAIELDPKYPKCRCGKMPEWYCALWSDKPFSFCLKEEKLEK